MSKKESPITVSHAIGKRSPIVVDSPHSGNTEPIDFAYGCSRHDLLKGQDRFVDELIVSLPNHGISTLQANFLRAYIDVNRPLDDLDPLLVDDDWDRALLNSERSKYGIGLIQRLATPSVPIYAPDQRLAKDDILHRINYYYTPYHDALDQLIDDTAKRHSMCLHLNMHSMPSTTLSGFSLPDIVIGDCNGQTCDRTILNELKYFFQDQGLKVTVNDPYQGVELIRKFSCPHQDRHSLQIEINKALYMDEISLEKNNRDFTKMKNIIEKSCCYIASFMQSLYSYQSAAE